MRIVTDENITLAEELFTPLGSVTTVNGRLLTNRQLAEADALIVRSTTRVNARLLQGTPVRFVGTATIGTDHIDTAYLAGQGIGFASAQGCNSRAVSEYVLSVLLQSALRAGYRLHGKTLGIVGVGNIGKLVAGWAPLLGINVLLCDPPRARAERSKDFVPLDALAGADIITTHVPLTTAGTDPTFHLWNRGSVAKLKENVVFINASRGEVCNTAALLWLHREKGAELLLDVWEGEPVPDAELLRAAAMASPHVAGYSVEGKINGTVMMRDALAAHFGLSGGAHPGYPKANTGTLLLPASADVQDAFTALAAALYTGAEDTARMKALIPMPEEQRGNAFDLLRRHYPLRREFSAFTAETALLAGRVANAVSLLGFR